MLPFYCLSLFPYQLSPPNASAIFVSQAKSIFTFGFYSLLAVHHLRILEDTQGDGEIFLFVVIEGYLFINIIFLRILISFHYCSQGQDLVLSLLLKSLTIVKTSSLHSLSLCLPDICKYCSWRVRDTAFIHVQEFIFELHEGFRFKFYGLPLFSLAI